MSIKIHNSDIAEKYVNCNIFVTAQRGRDFGWVRRDQVIPTTGPTC